MNIYDLRLLDSWEMGFPYARRFFLKKNYDLFSKSGLVVRGIGNELCQKG